MVRNNETFSPMALALTLGILGAVCMLAITYYPTFSRVMPFMSEHGTSLRFVMEDIYPIYTHTVWYKALLGPIFGFIDCFVLGYLFAYLYNWISAKK